MGYCRYQWFHCLPQQLGCWRPRHLRLPVHHVQFRQEQFFLLVNFVELAGRSHPGQVILQRRPGEGEQEVVGY